MENEYWNDLEFHNFVFHNKCQSFVTYVFRLKFCKKLWQYYINKKISNRSKLTPAGKLPPPTLLTISIEFIYFSIYNKYLYTCTHHMDDDVILLKSQHRQSTQFFSLPRLKLLSTFDDIKKVKSLTYAFEVYYSIAVLLYHLVIRRRVRPITTGREGATSAITNLFAYLLSLLSLSYPYVYDI